MFWSVYTPGEAAGGFAKTQLEQIDIARRLIAHYPDTFTLASTAADIRAAKAAGKIGGMLGAEGGHAIEDSLALLRMYYDLGVRYMTLTHNNHTSWADSAMDSSPGHGGLTEFGEQVVHEMNRVGMLIDLSHTAPDTMRDAIRVSKAPVIFSHSYARALVRDPAQRPRRRDQDAAGQRRRADGDLRFALHLAGRGRRRPPGDEGLPRARPGQVRGRAHRRSTRRSWARCGRRCRR